MSGWLLAQGWLFALGLWAHRARPGYSPRAWLVLMGAGLLPSAAALLLLALPDTSHTVAYALGKPSGGAGTATAATQTALPWPTLALAAYALVAAALCARTLLRLARLHRLARRSPLVDDVRVAETDLPPFALGWPSRSVVVGRAAWDAMTESERAMLLAHERTHLAHRDPEATLALLLLSHLLWFNPGLRLLVERWRAAVEVRADAAAARNPHPYSRLLLRLSRAHGLPSPTATHGDLSMRIKTLLSGTARTRLPRTVLAITATACAGTVALAANAADAPRPVKRVPPTMPETCPELLTTDIKLRVTVDAGGAAMDGAFDGSTYTATGAEGADVGEVVVTFDIDTAGQPRNIAVVRSNADCFRQPAVNAVAQWRYAEGAPTRDVSNMIRFRLMFEPGADVHAELMEFVGR